MPGGPGQASEYLGDLGGLSAERTLVVLENRGVQPSATPDDLGTLRVVGLPSDVGAEGVVAERSGEAWHAGALRALEASKSADTYDEAWSYWLPAAPLSYGRWTDAARAHAATSPGQFSRVAQEGFYAGFEPDRGVRERLAALSAPVLIGGGEHDLGPTRLALAALTALHPSAELFVQPGAGHFPWVDDAALFARKVDEFLT